MSDVKCPYCKAERDVCHDDGYGYDEGVFHEIECGKCDKKFVFQTTITFDYEATKADCLNGSPHNFKMTKTWPKRYTEMECADCGKRRKPTAEEFKAAGITEKELAS